MMDYDPQQAMDEGWCVVTNANGWLEIQRDDDPPCEFGDDVEAEHYVRESANDGSQYHLAALRHVTEANLTADFSGIPVNGWIYMFLRSWGKEIVTDKVIVRVRADYMFGDDPYASDAVPFAVGSNQDLVPLAGVWCRGESAARGRTLVLDNMDFDLLLRQKRSLSRLLACLRWRGGNWLTGTLGVEMEDVGILEGLEGALDQWAAELPTQTLTVTETLHYVFEVPRDMTLNGAEEFFCGLDSPSAQADSFAVVDRDFEIDENGKVTP